MVSPPPLGTRKSITPLWVADFLLHSFGLEAQEVQEFKSSEVCGFGYRRDAFGYLKAGPSASLMRCWRRANVYNAFRYPKAGLRHTYVLYSFSTEDWHVRGKGMLNFFSPISGLDARMRRLRAWVRF
jgi:hypothetical protein